MRHVIETGTDGAMVCLFDPAGLPADFDARSGDDPVGLFEALREEGKFWLAETGGDGEYLFHFYVDEDPPAEVVRAGGEAREAGRLEAPSGVVWACGAEYAARDPGRGHGTTPAGGLGAYPHMGGKVELPAGEYDLTVWRPVWPDDAVAELARRRVGEGPWRRYTLLRNLGGVIAVGLLVGVVTAALLTLGRRTREGMGWGGIAALWAGLVGVGVGWFYLVRAVSKSDARAKEREVEREFPDFVVGLKRRK